MIVRNQREKRSRYFENQNIFKEGNLWEITIGITLITSYNIL